MKRREFVGGMMAAGALTAFRLPEWQSEWAFSSKPGTTRLNQGWRFHFDDAPGAEVTAFNDASWDSVALPHTARIEALVTGPAKSPTAQWQGLCWYRRTLRVDEREPHDRVLLKFDGAMNVADVWLDGRHLGQHLGGYLPYVVDISDAVTSGRDHTLAVRLDNRDNPITGPKPLAQLDFNMYHGLYRSVHLIHKNALHITDPILAGRPASGGIFVTYPKASREAATVRVQTHVRNDDDRARTFRVRLTLTGTRDVVARSVSQPVTLQPGTDTDVTENLEVQAPKLWSPVAPNLHTLKVEVLAGDVVTDMETLRVGIRRFETSPRGFSINGEPMFLRGTNRHQEYPYIGYALSDAAQFRDARKIKEAGFDYIRLSHYAHSPAFMDACDELGIVVMNCIPGWQYFGKDPAFTELQYRNSRDLIRRDRNHPCVIMWEVSLNETEMPPEFIAKTHAIGHEEYPGDQCYTAGWVKGYDVFIQARQHGGCHKEKDSACVVSEYGDWEYYSMTAGLNQHEWEKLSPSESNSRQLRWQGERALLQQAANFQEAHNDNRTTIAFADGLWVMYDYNRGYSPDIESSGCMDIFRLPKFSYEFFKSQRSATERLVNAASGPMVFIASYWNDQSSPDVRVFSNCEEVALYLNDKLIERRKPDSNALSTRLLHPPFTFQSGGFKPGTLRAVGYIGGREAARYQVRTPGAVERLDVSIDFSGRNQDSSRKDTIFCYAALEDANGIVASDAWHNVAYGVTGPAAFVGMSPLASDAGISSNVLVTQASEAPVTVFALALIPGTDGMRAVSGSAALKGRAPAHELRFTTDGSEPNAESGLYRGPIRASKDVRVALISGGKVVAQLSSEAPKFRIPISAPPDWKRTPFEK